MGRLVCRRYDAASGKRTRINPGSVNRAKSTSHAANDPALTDEDGAVFTLIICGAALLINFWASWCAPCIAEMPSLQKAAEQLHPDGIDVLLISLDRGGVKGVASVARTWRDDPA